MAEAKGGVRMYSVLQQEKTALRDGRGMTVYRRLYLCDTEADIPTLPVEDAPGSGALVAEGGGVYLLNHARVWCSAPGACGMGGGLWRS
jgi:hypothetical protein